MMSRADSLSSFIMMMTLFLLLAPWIAAVVAVRRGEVAVLRWLVRRDREPGVFGLVLVLHVGVGLMLLWCAVWLYELWA